MIIREPSFLVRLMQGDTLWHGQRSTSDRLRKSDTVFTRNLRLNLRSNLMLSPKFDFMSYAEKYIQLVKHVAGLSILNGGIGNRLEIFSPNSLVTVVTL